MRALELKVPPPVVALVVAGGMVLADRRFPGARLAIPAHVVVALCAGLAGLATDFAGLLAFRRHRTTVNPLKPERSTALVRDGIYRLTRNPMYLGMLLILFGWAFWLANVAAFAGPLLFLAWITRFQIIPEERALARRFPDEFADYVRSVRRWL